MTERQPHLQLTFYKRPNGEQHQTEITDIEPEDETFFRHHSIQLSAESGGPLGGYILYGDTGLLDAEGEPIEEIVISAGRSCRECMTELAAKCKPWLESGANPAQQEKP